MDWSAIILSVIKSLADGVSRAEASGSRTDHSQAPFGERSTGTRGGGADLAQTWLSSIRSGIRRRDHEATGLFRP